MKYYNWRTIEGYNLPLNIVLGGRGIGKTFGKVKDAIKDFVLNNNRFIYVVETKEMVDTLAQNKGEKFFSAYIEYLQLNPSNTNKKIYNLMYPDDDKEGTNVEGNDEEELKTKDPNRIIGGTIKIHNDTAGYIVAINDFANLKRNNFIGIKTIIIDEFIAENVDIRHIQMPRKIVSIIQSIARLKNVKIYMLGNTIRPNDIILSKLGIDNLKLGEFRVIKDKYGAFGITHMVNMEDYKEYSEKQDASVAGRFATLLHEDNLDKNTFKQALDSDMEIPDNPKASHLLFCLHGEAGSVRINVTKDHNNYYVLNDYGENTRKRICFDEKFVSPVVNYVPDWKDQLLYKYTNKDIKFESSAIHILFKSLLKLDTN